MVVRRLYGVTLANNPRNACHDWRSCYHGSCHNAEFLPILLFLRCCWFFGLQQTHRAITKEGQECCCEQGDGDQRAHADKMRRQVTVAVDDDDGWWSGSSCCWGCFCYCHRRRREMTTMTEICQALRDVSALCGDTGSILAFFASDLMEPSRFKAWAAVNIVKWGRVLHKPLSQVRGDGVFRTNDVLSCFIISASRERIIRG